MNLRNRLAKLEQRLSQQQANDRPCMVVTYEPGELPETVRERHPHALVFLPSNGRDQNETLKDESWQP